MKRLSVLNNSLSYTPFGLKESFEVQFWKDLPEDWSSPTLIKFEKALIVWDTAINRKELKNILDVLKGLRIEIVVYDFHWGKKSIENLSKILKRTVEVVPDVLIGVGGGTTCDLVGFASAIYQRGIPSILFPSTTLSMVDASIGGKTAIDFNGVKNSVGAVKYPNLVVNNLSLLDSLPDVEFYSGFAEVVKAAMLFDKNFFNLLEDFSKNGKIRTKKDQLLKIMEYSAGLKMKNSEKDQEEKIKLLYGHSVGHALEVILPNAKHGECVAMGMNIEANLASSLGFLSPYEVLSQEKLISDFNLPIFPPQRINVKLLIDKMSLYKKLSSSDSISFIFPSEIGVIKKRSGSFTVQIKKDKLEKMLVEKFPSSFL